MKLPIAENDPMLDAMDAAQEAAQTKEKRRPYLGMSSLGNECSRQLWYSFRWSKTITFKAQTLRYFDDGHRTEDLIAERIKAVPGVELQTHSIDDPERQIGWRDFGGHLRGHADGILTGLIQAPKTRHLWENKAVNDKKFAKLEKLKKVSEKLALSMWDPIYYAQQVLYMDYEGLTRSWMTVTTPGGRKQIGVRTEADPAEAIKLKAKAEKIIFSDSAPDKISEADKVPPCLWCDFKELCRGREAAERNCRTCAHSTPEKDGTWSCGLLNKTLDYAAQEAGCQGHRYNPAFVPGEAVDSSVNENWIGYKMEDGSFWRDEG
tara:strand:- start:12953 stop:13912 length:960 start_codon:yes stop_codon:yes gene_type:complete